MRLETLEKYLNKDQTDWTRDDLEKLIERFGRYSIFRETEGITNKLFNLFKYRYEAEHNKIISDFLSRKNNEFDYIIKFISDYLDYIDFVFWPSEIAIQVIYKILCERIIEIADFTNTESYVKMIELVEKIKQKRINLNMK